MNQTVPVHEQAFKTLFIAFRLLYAEKHSQFYCGPGMQFCSQT